ncbi:MAG: hypothetical protein JSR70_08570 [Proteobacteria bacterium]|nr:hypothetical protein [Pseudomonadota bacterium]
MKCPACTTELRIDGTCPACIDYTVSTDYRDTLRSIPAPAWPQVATDRMQAAFAEIFNDAWGDAR